MCTGILHTKFIGACILEYTKAHNLPPGQNYTVKVLSGYNGALKYDIM